MASERRLEGGEKVSLVAIVFQQREQPAGMLLVSRQKSRRPSWLKWSYPERRVDEICRVSMAEYKDFDFYFKGKENHCSSLSMGDK